MQTDIADARAQFIVPGKGAYFDCAYKGLVPCAAAEAAANSLKVLDCPWKFGNAEELRLSLIDIVASIVGVTTEDIALIPSVSHGMALARSVVRLWSGEQVLVLEDEHPSAVLPWYDECNSNGVDILTVKKSASKLTEAILSAMNDPVKVVCIPQVHWIDGTPIELDKIGKRAKEIGAHLIVDATQSVGGRPFNIPDFEPDIVIFSGYKWLFGPIGVAYLYVAPELRRYGPLEHSWISYAGMQSHMFDANGVLRYPTQPLQGMHRFDASGLHNSLMMRMALAGANLVRNIGTENILAHNVDIIARLEEEFPSYLDKTNIPNHFIGMRFSDARGSAKFLADRSIYVSGRGRHLRISPNIWNNENDVEDLIAGLKSLAIHHP